MTPARRLQQLPPYQYAVIGQRIRELTADGKHIIRLDIGSPDTPPPPAVIEALCASASRPDRHGYSGYKGTSDFRQAIGRYYEQRFGVHLDAEREILPLLGSKEGIVNFALAHLDPGDLVLIPDIGYPSYAMGAYLAGARIHWIPLNPENGFCIDLAAIPAEVADKARLMWINYPNNPTGAVLDRSQYDQIVAFCLQHNILLASDNPYVDITYDGYRAGSVLQSPNAFQCCVEFISFSKTYNMAGWRLGAAVGCAAAVSALLQIKSNVDSGHFHSIYDAGIAALDTTSQSWIDARNQLYESRRNRVMPMLSRAGLIPYKPAGAIYVWAKVARGDGDSYVRSALEDAHVSIGPGSLYGPGGMPYVRISLTCPDEQFDEAIERLISW
mgnify:CR=1 FL=1